MFNTLKKKLFDRRARKRLRKLFEDKLHNVNHRYDYCRSDDELIRISILARYNLELYLAFPKTNMRDMEDRGALAPDPAFILALDCWNIAANQRIREKFESENSQDNQVYTQTVTYEQLTQNRRELDNGI